MDKKPFNLQDALAGKPVVTRAGEAVQEIHYFESNTEGLYPVVAIVNGEKFDYTKLGVYDVRKPGESSRDLLMAAEYEWANIYRDGSSSVTGYIYPTEAKADEMAGTRRIACIKLEKP